MIDKAQVSPGGIDAIRTAMGPYDRAVWIGVFVLSAIGSAAILYALHDRFWWPPDEGAYAHVAERILRGDVLNGDIQDVHAGYINFVNAFALWIFGQDLVSLRYPLALCTFLQSCLVFFLLSPRGPWVAGVGAVAMAALSFVQFLNPTAHWYALFLTVVIIAVLTWMPRTYRWRLPVLGFLIVTLFLFRQLSGVFISIGVITFLLLETRDGGQSPGRPVLARLALGIMALGLAAYLLGRTDIFAIVLVGLGPICVVAIAFRKTRATNVDVGRIALNLLAGGLLALLPLLLYHWANGSIGTWISDTVVAAFHLTELNFFEITQYKYLQYMAIVIGQVVVPGDLLGVANGLFWIAMLLAAPIAAATMIVRHLVGANGAIDRSLALPFIAVFYALVSAHFQIPIYLLYSAALSVVALLWLFTARSGSIRPSSIAAVACLSMIGLYYQAGQPLSRGIGGILAGQRVALVRNAALDKATLRVDPKSAALYRKIVRLIRIETPNDAAILAVPVNPELYFLAGRRNPTRFFNTALGVRSEADLYRTLDILKKDPPALVFHRPDDKYNTSYSARIMAFVRLRYDALPPFAGFEIYRRRSGSSPDDIKSGKLK